MIFEIFSITSELYEINYNTFQVLIQIKITKFIKLIYVQKTEYVHSKLVQSGQFFF